MHRRAACSCRRATGPRRRRRASRPRREAAPLRPPRSASGRPATTSDNLLSEVGFDRPTFPFCYADCYRRLLHNRSRLLSS
jgi:hypothetical protein